MRALAPTIALVALFCTTGVAQTSELFLLDGDGESFRVMQGGVVIRDFPQATLERTFPLAVLDTITSTGYAAGETGGEYTLAGADLGTRFARPPVLLDLTDGTTDGTFHYAVSYQGGSPVYRFDRNWANPVTIFTVGRGMGGITWDPTDDTFWISSDRAAGIEHFTKLGVSLGSFATAGELDWVLAYEPSTDSLWVRSRADGRLYNYSKTGVLIQDLPGPQSPVSFYSGEFQLAGGRCLVTVPSAGVTVTGDVMMSFDVDHSMPGTPVDALVEHSTDGGATWSTCTPTMGVNPILGLATPSAMVPFTWDSLADGIGLSAPQTTTLRITIDDGTVTSSCAVAVDVDNVVPPPTCTVSAPGAQPLSGDIGIVTQPDSPSSPTVDITLDYSLDGGTTWLRATPAAGSPANPILGHTAGVVLAWDWDSRADGVALLAVAPGVLIRATVDDPAPLPGECTSLPIDVDNQSLCPGLCGDCDQNGFGPNVLDALLAAQIAASLLTPTPAQTGCCDVNASMTITVLDALFLAQSAASLPVTLMCP